MHHTHLTPSDSPEYIKPVPADQGYCFPAEWEPHEATWLSFPHNSETFPPHILKEMYPAYGDFVREIAKGEKVKININDEATERLANELFTRHGADLAQIQFFKFPTNDAWCRDHGPSFVINKKIKATKAVINWGYNAWEASTRPFISTIKYRYRWQSSIVILCLRPALFWKAAP